jgi:citrate synthase
MDAVLCGIVDHGLFAPTGLAVRVVVSAAPESIMSAVAAGMLTVGALTVSQQDTAVIIEEALKMVKDDRPCSIGA